MRLSLTWIKILSVTIMSLAVLTQVSNASSLPVQPPQKHSNQLLQSSPNPTHSPAQLKSSKAVAADAIQHTTKLNPLHTHRHDICPPEEYDDIIHPHDRDDYIEMMPTLEDLDAAMGYFFSLSTLFLYLPQLFGLMERRSTFGLSVSSLFLASVANIATFFTVLVMDYYFLKGCSEVGMHCVPYIQPFIQAVVTLVILLPLYGLSLWIYVHHDMHNPRIVAQFARDPEHGPAFMLSLPRRKFIELVSLISMTAVFLVVFLALAISVGVCHSATRTYGRVQGLIGTLFTMMQWWPQIILTWDIKEKGSLSMTTLLSFALNDIFSIFYLLHTNQDWSIWLSNAADLVMVTSLMTIVLFFEANKRRLYANHQAQRNSGINNQSEGQDVGGGGGGGGDADVSVNVDHDDVFAPTLRAPRNDAGLEDADLDSHRRHHQQPHRSNLHHYRQYHDRHHRREAAAASASKHLQQQQSQQSHLQLPPPLLPTNQPSSNPSQPSPLSGHQPEVDDEDHDETRGLIDRR